MDYKEFQVQEEIISSKKYLVNEYGMLLQGVLPS